MNMTNILHSGGAIGSDRAWEMTGYMYGLQKENVFHYYYNHKTPFGNTEISLDDFAEGRKMVKKANEILHRRPEKYINLLARNWCQVKYSDATFAIANDIDLKTSIVSGGTGWAVAMSIMAQHPTYVYKQEHRQWYFYSVEMKKFVEYGIPTLTKKYAGIGTREITGSGLDAIASCYMKIAPLEH